MSNEKPASRIINHRRTFISNKYTFNSGSKAIVVGRYQKILYLQKDYINPYSDSKTLIKYYRFRARILNDVLWKYDYFITSYDGSTNVE